MKRIHTKNTFLVFLGAALFIGCKTEAPKTEEAETVTEAPKPERKASYENAPKPFQIWVDGRAGTGEAVHWLAEGSVYAYPSGEKLFGMIGFDSSTVIWPDDDWRSLERIQWTTRSPYRLSVSNDYLSI